MDVLITYDIATDDDYEAKNTEVKDGMKELGYFDYFIVIGNRRNTTSYLPNTTLCRKNTTPEQAKNDLISIAEEVDAEIERLVAVEFTNNWAAIEGEPYSEE